MNARKLLLAVVGWLALGAPALGAIAFDAATQGYANSTSLTWSHTCTGSDRFLVVGIKLYGTNDITGITYAGVAMTHIGSEDVPGEATKSVLYGLTAPATGANNIIISRTSSGHIVASGASYTGVSQTGQPEAFGVNTANSTVVNITATVTTENAWLVGTAARAYTGANISGGTDTTLRIENSLLLPGLEAAGDSNGPLAAGSRTLQFSSGLANWAGVVASLAPSGAGPPPATVRRQAIICMLTPKPRYHRDPARPLVWSFTRG